MILALALSLVAGSLRLESEWTCPEQLPFPRVHALVRTKDGDYVGGLRGLATGKPGAWKVIDERPVKQMVSIGDAIWVLYGDGSVDKIEAQRNRLIYDILNGVAKRPWVSSLASDGKTVTMGGQGGWFERGQEFIEKYPKELSGQVVTAMARNDGTLWLGTQKKGLFELKKGALTRYGFAAGLLDSWVTSLLSLKGELYVGMADGGLVRLEKNRFVAFASPCQKVRLLATYKGKVVVGGMEGCWIKDGSAWQRLSEEETTILATYSGKLAVGTPTRLRWFGDRLSN